MTSIFSSAREQDSAGCQKAGKGEKRSSDVQQEHVKRCMHDRFLKAWCSLCSQGRISSLVRWH